MRIILQVTATILLGFLGHQFLPFWAMAPAAAIAALYFRQGSGFSQFGTGFIAGLILWSATAGFIDSSNLGLLSGKIASIFQVGGWHLILLTGFIGGLLGGLGALSGFLGAKLFLR